jgi:NADH:ubiquinone oxidoreductase subunit 6 (subunit J)
MMRLPKLPDVAAMVVVLQKNPFGSLVLLLILAMALAAWLTR